VRIGIVGGGITGLAAAYELAQKGHEIEIFEASEAIGGIAGAVQIDGFYLEKYYHHFFKSDIYVLEFLRELGLESKLLWKQSRMGYYSGNRSYDFGTPRSLLRFKPLPFMDKLMFGMSVLKLMAIKDWRALENITAKDWLVANAGEKAFRTVWKPLLVSKFGEEYDKVSMAWMWGKIRLRGTSKENGQEVLGYIDGSSSALFERLTKVLEEKGVKINLGCKVEEIRKAGDSFSLKIYNRKGGQWLPLVETASFDRVIAAVPLPIFGDLASELLPGEYIEKIKNIRYTSVVCTVLLLKKPLSPFYWLNIGDEGIPFGGLIEHTNLMEKSLYNGKHVLYISHYLYSSEKCYDMSSEGLLKEYLPQLKKINPEFEESWIEAVYSYKDEYAQPVIKCGYSRLKPEFETPVKGLYTAGMCNIYPEDRGVNYAIRDGKAVAKLISQP